MNAYDILQNLCKTDDKLSIITSVLDDNKINYELRDENVIVSFSDDKYCNVIGAHYDIVEGVPGANDNGASVAELLDLVVYLKNDGWNGKLDVVFFDGEELIVRNAALMGSFKFGKYLRSINAEPEFILIMDVCGNGDTVIVSEWEGIEELAKPLTEGLEYDCIVRHTPPSDNYGLSRSGYNSVLMTILPADEVHINYPDTWRKIHSEEDNMDSIDINTLFMVKEILLNVIRNCNDD